MPGLTPSDVCMQLRLCLTWPVKLQSKQGSIKLWICTREGTGLACHISWSRMTVRVATIPPIETPPITIGRPGWES